MENLDWLLGWGPILISGIIFGAVVSWVARDLWEKMHVQKPSLPKRLFTLDLPIKKRFKNLSFDVQELERAFHQCPECHYREMILLTGRDRRIHDGRLGQYCLNCLQGELFKYQELHRKHLHLPNLTGLNLLQVLETLERDAIARGLLKEPMNEGSEKSKSFITTVSGTGGPRIPPMRVSVNPETQTVRPVEDEALAEAELADRQAGETAKRTLPD